MPITRRTLIAGGATMAVAAAVPAAVAAAPEAITFEQALNVIGPDRLISELERGFVVSMSFPRHPDYDIWHPRFVRQVSASVRIAYARGPVTVIGLGKAVDPRSLFDALGDQTLPADVRAETLSALESIPGFDLSLGRRQQHRTADVYEYVSMNGALLIAKLSFRQPVRDLMRGTVDWASLDV